MINTQVIRSAIRAMLSGVMNRQHRLGKSKRISPNHNERRWLSFNTPDTPKSSEFGIASVLRLAPSVLDAPTMATLRTMPFNVGEAVNPVASVVSVVVKTAIPRASAKSKRTTSLARPDLREARFHRRPSRRPRSSLVRQTLGKRQREPK